MIIIYHSNNKIVKVTNDNTISIEFDNAITIAAFLSILAKEYPDVILVWCHVNFKEHLNLSEIKKIFHHKKLLLSFSPSENFFIDKSIGYIDQSPFALINRNVTFASWQMSSNVGGIHADVILALNNLIPFDENFDYFLCSLSKLGIQKGLLCYSEPSLLKQNFNGFSIKPSKYTLFRFVKQHYKTRWVFLLLLNLVLYERKFPLLPLLFSLFYKNRNDVNLNLDYILVQSSRKVLNKRSIDVIIPTIGRKKYLYDVLKDFSKQILLPNKIIIVEQNPAEESETELNYIQEEKWPFEIQHLFIHQSGACNARNIALKQTDSEWVFFADDDIRIENNFIQKIFEPITAFGAKAVSTKCYQNGNNSLKDNIILQWPTFGAGCSFVKSELLEKVKFNKGYEFGYGEDGDFGMQLRNQGVDILYLPEPSILHLKAPIGGFRSKPQLQWQNDSIQPKPSPTIMLYYILNSTQEQIKGYKTTLFFKYYQHQKIKNPICYFLNYKKQWKRSVFWANNLNKQNEV